MRLNRQTWNQFVGLAKPYWFSEQKWFPRVMTAFLILLLLAYTHFSVVFNQQLGEFTSSLAAGDGDRFWKSIRLFLFLLILAVPINAFYYFVRDSLANRWRQWMTSKFLGEYFHNRAYYELSSSPTIDNPDQRISEDINTFTQKTLQFLLIAVNGLMQLLAFSAVLWSISKLLVAFLLCYALIGTVITIAVFGKGLTLLNYLQLKREANFRFSLVRIRENAESIAFYQGEGKELSLVASRFGKAFTNYGKLIWWQLFLSMFQYANSYASYLLPYVILGPAILAGELEVGTVIEAGGAFAACLTALNLFIDNFDGLSKFSAGINRLDSFHRAMANDDNSQSLEETIVHEVGAELRLEHVTVQVPGHERVLIDDLSLTVGQGDHLVISGPSGCGKTSLLRSIIGLWDHGSGLIVCPKLDDVLFLPQRPYMIPGSLRSQLLYPRLDLPIGNDKLRQILTVVNLEHLAAADDALNNEADWSKVLSIGEQQRLSFARLLLIRPKYAFLDEATSALDPDSEEKMYGHLKETDTTFISISHRPAIHKYHRLDLELLGDGAWRLKNVQSQGGAGGGASHRPPRPIRWSHGRGARSESGSPNVQ